MLGDGSDEVYMTNDERAQLEVLRAESVAWAGGFFDGEGSVCLNKSSYIRKSDGGSCVSLQISASSTDRDSLERFQKGVGGLGRIKGPYRASNPRHKAWYEWRTHSFEVGQTVIAMLWPWLNRRRKDKIKEVLTQIQNQPLGVSHYIHKRAR